MTSAAATRPRVLLVDDDAAIRRLVDLALEDLDVDLVCCADGREALDAMRQGPARLVITDLMMPGISGYALLQQLADDPALRGGARLAVFSAGLNAQAKERLAGLPVWRLIDKPTPVIALADIVEAALQGDAVEPADADAPPHDAGATAVSAAAAIDAHFGGDAALYRAFLASCLLQFPDDLRQGDAAVAAADAPSLRRVAHSLKSVLLLVGEAEASDTARRLEHAAEAADWDACHGPWQALAATLRRMTGDTPAT
ncbi:response regulator [Rubrivivax albus]|uniref:Response regulator n=1 Tax=Rubrivivax albus TaxID=2499835 RepID=A0A437JQX1_9BURK|nr:response regulator [Rubrivivax albus]RVT49284.1 response regulator [Rubrivivax albus]